jgi:hypothetical protein
MAEPVAVAALGGPGGGVGFLDSASAGEEGDGGTEFGDVTWSDSDYHRGGGLLRSFDWVRLQEPGREDGNTYGIRDGKGEGRKEVLLIGRHVASGEAMYGKVDLIRSGPEGAVGVVSHGEGLVQLVSHGLIVRGVSSGGSV